MKVKANKKNLEKALNKINWSIRKTGNIEIIFDHDGNKTDYQVNSDSIQLLDCPKNTTIKFLFNDNLIEIIERDTVSISPKSDSSFILFMNHDLTKTN